MEVIKPDTIIKNLEDAVINPYINLKPIVGIVSSTDPTRNENYYIQQIQKCAEFFNTEVIVKQAKSLVQASQFLNDFKRDPYMCGIINAADFGNGNQSLNDTIPVRLDVNCYSAATAGQFIKSTDPVSYRLGPCGAIAACKVLEYSGMDMERKRIAILGYSSRFCRPVAETLCRKKAIITVYPEILEDINLSNYDIVISSLFDKRRCLVPELWKDGFNRTTHIIDAGTNTDEEGRTLGNLLLEDFIPYNVSVAPLIGCIDKLALIVLFAKLFKNAAQINGVFYE